MYFKKYLILFFFLPMFAQSQVYVSGDGGWGGYDLNFSVSTYAQENRVYSKVSYFYSINRDLLNFSIGFDPFLLEKWKFLVLWGVEINNSFEPKLSVETWRKIENIWIKTGVESARGKPYFFTGISVNLSFNKNKEIRFF